jgi:hypothetical protein
MKTDSEIVFMSKYALALNDPITKEFTNRKPRNNRKETGAAGLQ